MRKQLIGSVPSSPDAYVNHGYEQASWRKLMPQSGVHDDGGCSHAAATYDMLPCVSDTQAIPNQVDLGSKGPQGAARCKDARCKPRFIQYRHEFMTSMALPACRPAGLYQVRDYDRIVA